MQSPIQSRFSPIARDLRNECCPFAKTFGTLTIWRWKYESPEEQDGRSRLHARTACSRHRRQRRPRRTGGRTGDRPPGQAPGARPRARRPLGAAVPRARAARGWPRGVVVARRPVDGQPAERHCCRRRPRRTRSRGAHPRPVRPPSPQPRAHRGRPPHPGRGRRLGERATDPDRRAPRQRAARGGDRRPRGVARRPRRLPRRTPTRGGREVEVRLRAGTAIRLRAGTAIRLRAGTASR